MKDGLLEEIKGLGHWRVVLRPLGPPGKYNPLDLMEDVRRCSVSIRGWDFPHITMREDEHSGMAFSSSVEQWTSWYRYREFWRIYPSGQFIWMGALREDFFSEDETFNKPDGPFISVLGAVYSITEFFEFTKRMVESGPLSDGAQLSIALRNTRNRILWISEGNRMPFSVDYRTAGDSINLKRDVTPSMAMDAAIVAANPAIVEFFSHFGWKSPAKLIEEDQRKFYQLRL